MKRSNAERTDQNVVVDVAKDLVEGRGTRGKRRRHWGDLIWESGREEKRRE